MPITIVTTPGSASANSYAEVAEADVYNSQHPFGSSWATGDVERKKAALIQATSLLDSTFPWTGAATTDEQELGWPRKSMVSRNGRPISDMTLPKALKDATSEFARQLLAADRAADNDAMKQDLTSLRAGSVSLGFNAPLKSTSVELRDADVVRAGPEFEWLGKVVPDAVRLLIPPSWYTRELVSQPLVFEAL